MLNYLKKKYNTISWGLVTFPLFVFNEEKYKAITYIKKTIIIPLILMCLGILVLFINYSNTGDYCVYTEHMSTVFAISGIGVVICLYPLLMFITLCLLWIIVFLIYLIGHFTNLNTFFYNLLCEISNKIESIKIINKHEDKLEKVGYIFTTILIVCLIISFLGLIIFSIPKFYKLVIHLLYENLC